MAIATAAVSATGGAGRIRTTPARTAKNYG